MANCTINEKLQYILETKDLIKAALETQDIEVLESDTFRKYAEYITEIRKVSSVNGKVGDVTITAEELGALTEIPSEYITESELNDKGYLTSIPDDYALKTDIPTNVSELNNDANYITLNEVPKTDLSDYYTKEEVDGKIPDVSDFITSIPSEYITESELNDKGYLTSIPDTYITEDELTTALSDKVSQTALNEAIEGIDVGVKTINNTKGDVNIKTINGESILGEGDITIKSGSDIEEYVKKINVDLDKSQIIYYYKNTDGDGSSPIMFKTVNGESLLGMGDIEIEGGGGVVTETDPIFDKWKSSETIILGNGAIYDTDGASEEEIHSSIIIGKDASVWADGIAIGENAYSESGAVTIGKNVSSYGIVSIGSDNEGSGIAIGKNNRGGGIIVGENNNGSGIAIGSGITENYGGIAIGEEIINQTEFGIAIGTRAKNNWENVDNNNSIAIGLNAQNNERNSIAFGVGAKTIGRDELAIGNNVETDATLPTNINDVIKGDSNKYAYIKDNNGNYTKILDLINNGGGSVKVVELTQAEYNALEKKEEGVIYVITDAAEIAIPTKLSELENDKGYITEIPSEYVTDTELNNKNYVTNTQLNNKNYITDSELTSTIAPLIVNVTPLENSIEVERYAKVKHYIYYKTINGESILGEGNIEIEGGGSGSGTINIKELTQAEYNALTSYDDDTFYVITDADKQYVIKSDLDNYYTKEEGDEHYDYDKFYWNDFQYTNDNYNWIHLRNGKSLRGNPIYFKTINGEKTVGMGDIPFKTINGESLIGSGDIQIQGGSADLSNYYTKSEIDSLIGNVSSKINEINNLI